MRITQPVFLMAIALVLASCGSQVVEFPLDSTAYAANDGGQEIGGDGGQEVGGDGGFDGGQDGGAEVAADADAGSASDAHAEIDIASGETADADVADTDVAAVDVADADAASPDSIDGAGEDVAETEVAGADVADTADTASDAADTAELDAAETDVSAADAEVAISDIADVDAAETEVAIGDIVDADAAETEVAIADIVDADTAETEVATADIADTDTQDTDTAETDVGAAGAPKVIATTPVDKAVGVGINKRPTATFSKAMDPLTLTGLTFTLQQGAIKVVGVVTYDAVTKTATFSPLVPLVVGKAYTATVTTGAKDTGGLAMAADAVWTFTTSVCSQAPVLLGSTAGFVILGGSTVTNTGLSSVTGDLGVSPGTAVTGFPPGSVVGSIHAGDPAAAIAMADLTIAYNDAAGRVLCPVSVAGNLGGQTLAPGLYKSTSSLAISSGDLTLDAQGDGDAVFIFQTASTLTTTDGRKVFLTNGAKAANVFWQVGTSATIGTTSSFFGTIMADQAVTFKTGATLTGRALARIAAVVLDSNVLVKPAP